MSLFHRLAGWLVSLAADRRIVWRGNTSLVEIGADRHADRKPEAMKGYGYKEGEIAAQYWLTQLLPPPPSPKFMVAKVVDQLALHVCLPL